MILAGVLVPQTVVSLDADFFLYFLYFIILFCCLFLFCFTHLNYNRVCAFACVPAYMCVCFLCVCPARSWMRIVCVFFLIFFNFIICILWFVFVIFSVRARRKRTCTCGLCLRVLLLLECLLTTIIVFKCVHFF